MATLGGQRGTFTWALGQYNKSDDPEQKTKWAKTMAKALSNAQVLGVTIDAIAQNKDYPDESTSI
jgi:hypothetical protein